MPSRIEGKSIEGFGISYIEAASYEIPSIGGKDGGASDAIKHGETGYLCDGNNLEEIYENIKLMIENKKYLTLGKNAKEFSKQFYWENIIKDYKKIINS
jgi:phosphatidylinositol alpha-1,6-mannosyltransferase